MERKKKKRSRSLIPVVVAGRRKTRGALCHGFLVRMGIKCSSFALDDRLVPLVAILRHLENSNMNFSFTYVLLKEGKRGNDVPTQVIYAISSTFPFL